MDFDTLYERYARDVYRFALYLSGRPHEADDITAETFVRAWTSGQSIRVGTVKAYLFMIARNLYRAGLRERGRTAALDETMRDPHDIPPTTQTRTGYPWRAARAAEDGRGRRVGPVDAGGSAH